MATLCLQIEICKRSFFIQASCNWTVKYVESGTFASMTYKERTGYRRSLIDNWIVSYTILCYFVCRPFYSALQLLGSVFFFFWSRIRIYLAKVTSFMLYFHFFSRGSLIGYWKTLLGRRSVALGWIVCETWTSMNLNVCRFVFL